MQELAGSTARETAKLANRNIPCHGRHAQFINEGWPGGRNPLSQEFQLSSLVQEFKLYCEFSLFSVSLVSSVKFVSLAKSMKFVSSRKPTGSAVTAWVLAMQLVVRQ